MALKFPNGAQFGISTAIAVAISASAVSNANPAVATVATGAVLEDDVLVVASNNPLLNNVVTQAGTVIVGATDSVPLLGVDTSDADIYDLTGATVTLARASGFVDFTQQGDPSTSGGEQQFWQGVFLEDPAGQQISVPTFKNAKQTTLPLYFDPSLPWYAAAKKADLKKVPVVIRCKLPDGDIIYRYGYVSFDGDPSIAANNPMQNTATFTSLGPATLVEAA
jgi:hypothetical protein